MGALEQKTMKLFLGLHATLAVSVVSVFENHEDDCKSILEFFKEDSVIRNESKAMSKMSTQSQRFYEVLAEAEKACNEGDLVQDESDDLDTSDLIIDDTNLYDAIEGCYENLTEYIDQKIPADQCPNANRRVNRVLTKAHNTLRKSAEKRTTKVLKSSMRKAQVGFPITVGKSQEMKDEKQ